MREELANQLLTTLNGGFNCDAANADKKDETDTYLAAVDTAFQACTRLKARYQSGVRVFLKRNLLYSRNKVPGSVKKHSEFDPQRAAPPAKSSCISTSSRLPLFVSDSAAPAQGCNDQLNGTNGSSKGATIDKRLKFQFVGFFDSEFQELWMTTSAEMRGDLIVDVRNVRKSTTHRFSIPLFNTPRRLHVNETVAEWSKRVLDSASVDLGEIFDNVRSRFGSVRVDRIRLHFQLLVTEIRRARRELAAQSKLSEQNVAAELGFVAPDCIASNKDPQRQYPAKYEATHILWDRRRRWLTNTATNLGHFEETIEAENFDLSNRFGEYELRLSVARVGNKATDCVYSEPCETSLDDSTASDSLEQLTGFESLTSVLKRMPSASAVDQKLGSVNGSFISQSDIFSGAQLNTTNGHDTEVSNSKKHTRRKTTSTHATSAFNSSSSGGRCKQFGDDDDENDSVAYLNSTDYGSKVRVLSEEQQQQAILRFRIVPAVVSDRPSDDSNLKCLSWLRQRVREPVISTSDSSTAKPEDAVEVEAETEADVEETMSSSIAARRTKRSAALDATNMMRIRDEAFESNFRLQPNVARSKRLKMTDDTCSGRKRKAVTNGTALSEVNGNFDGVKVNGHSSEQASIAEVDVEIKSNSPSASDADSANSSRVSMAKRARNKTLDTSASDHCNGNGNGNGTSQLESSVVDGDLKQELDIDQEVRYVFVKPDGSTVWRMVSVNGDQCLFCSARTSSLQSLLMHLTHVHVQFHFEADLELRCFGVVPKTCCTSIAIDANFEHVGHMPVIHLPDHSAVGHLKRDCSVLDDATLLPTYGNFKPFLTVSISIGLLFTRCYSTSSLDGSYKPQKRATETYVIVRHCNRLAREQIILRTLKARALIQESAFNSCVDFTPVDYNQPGLNRVFYHTNSYLPVIPSEIDEDSETENDPPWLHTRIATLLDDVIDLNDGEKQVMTIWCSHLLKHCEFVGDRKVARALESFVNEFAAALRKRRRNFVLLLSSLCDYGVINKADVRAAVRRLDEAQNSKIEADAQGMDCS